MRTFKHTIFLLLITVISIKTFGSASLSKDFNIRKKIVFSGDTSLVNKYTRFALKYDSKRPNLENIKANIDTAEMFCKKENIELPALLHLARAQYFFLSNDYNNSSQEATIALKLSNNNGETKTVIKTLIFLGRYSLRTGFFKESIDYFNNAITLAKNNHLKGYIPVCYWALSDVYKAMGNTKEDNSYMQMFINSASEEKDTLYIKLGCYYLGTSLTGIIKDFKVRDTIKYRDFKKADSLLKITLNIALRKRDTSFICLSMNNLGWNFYLEKDIDNAINMYNSSLRYCISGKRHSYAANAFGNLGTIYNSIGKTDQSLKYYKKAIEEAEVIQDLYDQAWIYQDMSDMYLQRRDTANAYKSFVLFKKFNDMLLSSSNTQGLADAKMRYDVETHNQELQLLSLRVSNQRLLIYGYTGLFVLILAIGILIFSRSRINAKRRISEMNRKVAEVTQANLRQQMNPHFIFNTLNSIQYYMYQHDKLATNNYLTKFSSLMRKVLENSQHTSIPLRDELEALNLYLDLEMIRFKDKFNYEIKVDEEIDPLLYKVPTMLIQPYVENSISHGLMPSEEKGLVRIILKLEKEYISCTIEDNGIGREAAKEKSKKMEKNHSSLGTQIVTSRLDLVNALYGTSLKTIYTDLKNINGEPEGTRVEIQIPIMI